MHQSQIADKFTIGSGTSCDYIYCNGVHFLKTVGDGIGTTTKAREAVKMLNEYALLSAVAEAASVVSNVLALNKHFELNGGSALKKAMHDLEKFRKSGGE